ncbi:MAG: MBL fold metallo-hydrolase [Micromonosporaceae bacterium]
MSGVLTVIGCRAGSPGASGPASGYVVEVASSSGMPVRLVIDCGPGVLAGLAARGLTDHIDALIISHQHADHSADVPPFGYHRSFPVIQPPVPLYGPTGIGDYLRTLDQIHGIPTIPEMATPIATQFPIHEVEPGDSFQVAGIQVDTLRAFHPVPCISIRLPQLGFVYTSDTGLTDELIDFSRGAALLLAEATYPTEEGRDFTAHGHMGGAEAGRLAREAGVDHLVVTHLSDFSQAAETEGHVRKHFDGRVSFAEPGQQHQL